MTVNIISYTVIFLHIHKIISINASGITQGNSNVIKNRRSVNQPLAVLVAPSKLKCMEQCHQLNGCASANYKDKKCELLDTLITNQAELEVAPGWSYIREYFHIL